MWVEQTKLKSLITLKSPWAEIGRQMCHGLGTPDPSWIDDNDGRVSHSEIQHARLNKYMSYLVF